MTDIREKIITLYFSLPDMYRIINRGDNLFQQEWLSIMGLHETLKIINQYYFENIGNVMNDRINDK